MPRLRRAATSLRWRLTAAYVALLVALLAGLVVFAVVAMDRSLTAVRTQQLRGDVAEGIRAGGARNIPLIGLGAPTPSTSGAPAPSASPAPGAVGAGRVAALIGGQTSAVELQRAICGFPDVPPRQLSVPIRAQLSSAAATELARRISAAAGTRIDVLIVDRQLAAIGHAPDGTSAASSPRLSSDSLGAALAGTEPPTQILTTDSGTLLVAAFPIPSGTRSSTCAAAQLAVSTDLNQTVISDVRSRLILAGVVVILLALLVGLILTGRALRPLHRLTLTAQALASGDLRARSRIEPRRDEVGVLAHAFDDMADRIEASFAAQAESEATTRRFIADASHELRTPVTALKGYIDVLRRGAAREPEVLDAALGTMAREAERMRVLVLDLLTLARLDARKETRLETIDLAALVASVLDDGVPGMPPHLERVAPATPVPVLADRTDLITIARNLLINACKYAPGVRQVWTVWASEGFGWLSVADDGPGIAAQDLPHVMERFYRGEKTRAREEGGSGLGLSIVDGLARSLGGSVHIASTEGVGTTVRVRFPSA